MHLGKSETVPDREIVGVFDIESATVSEATKSFLKKMQGGYKAVNLASDLPRSFVLTENEYTDRVYLTVLSSEALKKRAERLKTKHGVKEPEKNC